MSPIRVILFLIPFIWSIGLAPFANKVHPFVFGFPFLAFWLIAGTIIAFFCISALYYMDSKKQDHSQD